jgi:cell division protein FtsW (lipid II flippase)
MGVGLIFVAVIAILSSEKRWVKVISWLFLSAIAVQIIVSFVSEPDMGKFLLPVVVVVFAFFVDGVNKMFDWNGEK